MWYANGATFVLRPKHAAVFKMAASILSDMVGWGGEDDDCSGIGAGVFDELSPGQKQASIFAVVRALLDPKEEPPEVTAVLAATVDTIYRALEVQIELELDDTTTTVRQAVLDAIEETDYLDPRLTDPDEESDLAPPLDCTEMDKWEEMVETLRVELLEDYDFELADGFLDMPPVAADFLKSHLSIPPDYFTSIAEDPRVGQLAQIRRGLREILR